MKDYCVCVGGGALDVINVQSHVRLNCVQILGCFYRTPSLINSKNMEVTDA